jgi:tol-pal system protein YbgF
MRLIRLSILLAGFSLNTVVYAVAPVVDAYKDTDNTSSFDNARQVSANDPPSDNLASFSIDQRTTILEHQISNLNPLLVQIDDLKLKMQGLQGKIEEEQHRLKLLEEQVRSQYQAFDKRLTQKQVSISNTSSVKSNPSTTLSSTQISALEQTGTARRPISPQMDAAASPMQAASISLPTAAGERAYQTAFQLLKNKQYVPAIEGFENFVKKYPYDVNQPNANYFLGQLYLLQGQPEQSIARFNHFVKAYALDARVPDALLQLGLAYFAKGEKTVAMDTFKKIIRQYPDSKAAQSAQARLQQFQAMMSSATMTDSNT